MGGSSTRATVDQTSAMVFPPAPVLARSSFLSHSAQRVALRERGHSLDGCGLQDAALPLVRSACARTARDRAVCAIAAEAAAAWPRWPARDAYVASGARA